MSINRLLVIAGTHQREKEFSHSVADILIKKNNFDIQSSHNTINGDDNATYSDIWESEELVVAKLYELGNGIPSREWMKTQPIPRLMYLFDHLLQTGTQARPPRIAETYGGEGQWTSVHDTLIKTYNPLFFIDLHSYHEKTQNLEGKGMQINSYANKRYNPIIIKALNRAQEEHPEIYGPKQEQLENKYTLLSKLLDKEGDIKDKLIEALLNNNAQSDENTQLSLRIKNILTETKKLLYANHDAAYDKGWFFVNYSMPEPRGSYFLFEAKYWQKNQQEATAKFITEYLLPEIKLFEH